MCNIIGVVSRRPRKPNIEVQMPLEGERRKKMENYSPGSIAVVFHACLYILPSSDVVRISYPLELLFVIENTSSDDPFCTYLVSLFAKEFLK